MARVREQPAERRRSGAGFRTRSAARTIVFIAVAFTAIAFARSQPVDTPTPHQTPLTTTQPSNIEPTPGGLFPDLEQRLAALRPTEPESYLRLGEDVAAGATDARGRELARTLYTLAFVLDRRRSGVLIFPTATSACLALAEMSPNDAERAWLISMARSIDPRLSYPDWSRSEPQTADSNTAYLATVFVGLVRAGDSIRARRVIEYPGVRDLIRRHERLLSPINDTGGLSELEREMARWPCPECTGKRIVRRYQTNPPQYRVCSVCRGTLGPRIDPEVLAAHLRFESRLLAGKARSWAAQVVSDGGAPLRDADPSELPAAMNVNPDAFLWRNGGWAAPEREPE